MLSKKVPLLTEQVTTLESLNKTYIEQDSIRLIELNLCKNLLKEQEFECDKLNKQLKSYKNYAIFGSIITFMLGIIVCH